MLTRSYDQDYVVNGVNDTASGGLALTFVPDAVGNITKETVGVTGTGNLFQYDGLNRLTTVTDLVNTPVAAYTYEATGNRLSKQAGTATPVRYTYPYPAATHELLAIGDANPILRSYDAMGDTTAIGSTRGFGYDDTGRMNLAKNGAGTTQMQYATNALGQRVEKYLTGNAALTQFTAYDEFGHVLGDYDNSSARIRETVWMDDLPVGVISGSGSTPNVAYIEPDQLGSPRTAIDKTSNLVVWRWIPLDDPFGEKLPQNFNGSTLTLNLRFPGQVYDAESGLYHNGFRDYEPGTGRYVESDPIGLFGGISTYGYVGGNPLINWDPYGLMAWPPALPQGLVDGVTGFGDGAYSGLTLGLVGNLQDVRDKLGVDGGVNHCSSAYKGWSQGGSALGAAATVGLATGRVLQIANVRGAQAAMLSFQLWSGGIDAAAITAEAAASTEPASLMGQLTDLVDFAQEDAFETEMARLGLRVSR